MKRVVTASSVALALFTATFQEPASAYQDADSSWTDYQYIKWKGFPGYLISDSDNALGSSGPDAYCNRVSFRGRTTGYARKATATRIIDYWGVTAYWGATYGDSFEFTAPAGVVRTDPNSMALIWETPADGSSVVNRYEGTPVIITTGDKFYTIRHMASVDRYVGAKLYGGPMALNFDRVC